jgi:ABC-type dipeptide/oligopeptide/nickel transport system ATPase subunit
MRTFDDKPAVRSSVPLLVGLMGPSGGGKTYSALRLATGIQEVVGGDIFVIDTEARRALHYADYFKFRHVEFAPPYRSADYLAAIEHCVAKGAKVVVVDSMTHEHAGPGGYLDFAEEELTRMAGDDFRKREACKLASFIKPSQERRRMIDGILRLPANFVFCFRAKERVKPMKDERGKTRIENVGFMPVAGPELVFEMTCCGLLLPHAGGVPTWQSEDVGERMMIKTARQFDSLFADSRPLDEDHGRGLALWAKGGAEAPQIAKESPLLAIPQVDLIIDRQTLMDIGRTKAEAGMGALKFWWLEELAEDQRKAIGKAGLDELKETVPHDRR